MSSLGGPTLKKKILTTHNFFTKHVLRIRISNDLSARYMNAIVS